MKFYLLAFLLFIMACSENDPNTPVDPPLPPPSSDGNVGPRANTADDPTTNVLYVSPAGNDATADGSIGKPYKSINTALAAAAPGYTIILRGGTYREGAATEVRVRQPNITIKSKKGEWAHIDLPFPANPLDPNDGNSAIHFDPEASGCKLQCVEVTGGWYAVCFDSKWAWGGPDDQVAATGIIIEDCKLHDSRFDVIKLKPNCDNITIRYNEIYNSGKAFPGSSLGGENNAEGIDNVNADNMKVQNNYFHDICSNAVYAKGGAADALIENNIIEHVYGAGIMIGFDTGPSYFDTRYDPTKNPHYYENFRGIVRNNLIIDAGWEGIGLYASIDAQVYNNTMVNVANYGPIPRGAIYFGISLLEWDTSLNGIGHPANKNPNIHHNIVCQPAAVTHPMVEIRYDNNDQLGIMSGLDGNPTMNNNCYYIVGKSAIFRDNRPSSPLPNGNLAAWKTHISDNSSIEVNPSLNADNMPTNTQCAGMGITVPLKY